MRPVLSVEEFRETVLAGIPSPRAVVVPLEDAFGCVLAAEMRAPADLPAFPSSAMDGFAVRSCDLAGAAIGAPVELVMAGEVRMGFAPGSEVAQGCAVAVPTGGMMPAGADTVVPVEDCLVEGGVVRIETPSRPGRNIRPAGEDLLAGEELVRAGSRLGAADLGALAAAGAAEVRVFPRPRVVIFSTGNELVEGGRQARHGQIHESNSFMLRGLVRQAGAESVYAGQVPDDPEALLRALDAAPPGEVLLCSGGVSAGRDDPVRAAFAGRGEVSCVQVKVQPGRPQAFGRWAGKPFFGLPGNPMASLVSFELFVRPALQKMLGLPGAVAYLDAVLEGPLEAAPDAVRYVPVRLNRAGPLLAAPGGPRRSNQLAKLARADGLAEVPPGAGLSVGDRVRVISIRER
ncbi:MAG: gephyrin-like molybdotransferase Glp [Actinomycetota bacterium]